MKHQIKHLLLAILLFAGIATSATKADEIEGTWSQEGQYKKFSKEYTDLKLFEVSADGTKIAIVSDSSLRIFDIQSGLIQTKLTIPNISDYPHQPYCISKDFKYIAISYMNMDIYVEYQEYYRIFNTMILDITTQDTLCWVTNTTSSELLSSRSIFPKPEYMFFTNDNILQTRFAVTVKDSNSKEFSQRFIFDCPKQTIVNKIDINGGFTYIFKTKVASKYVVYDNNFHMQDVTGSDKYQYYYSKVLYCKFDTSLIRLAGESWSHRSDEPAPPHTGFCPTPLGITGDDKMLMTQNRGEYIFYDLDSLGKTHSIDTAYYPYPVLAVLFPNSKNNKSFLTIHNADLASVKISQRSYIDGSPLASYEVYGNHFRNYGNIYRLIDSNRIVICNNAPYVRRIYILDLNLKSDYSEFDITSDIQSGTTNDTVKFSIKYPATHGNIVVDYGDGSSDSEYPFHHVYSKPGTYSVQINALNKDHVYEALRRKEYININQGLELSCDVFHYCMPENIQMKVMNTSTGNHDNQSITIAPLSNLANSREIKGKDTLIAFFTEYGKYKITIKAIDSNEDIICRKDSIIDINKTSSPNISFEKNFETKFDNSTGIKVFENYNTLDFLNFKWGQVYSDMNYTTINEDDILVRNSLIKF